jgi:hypothetical protein
MEEIIIGTIINNIPVFAKYLDKNINPKELIRYTKPRETAYDIQAYVMKIRLNIGKQK